MLLAPQSPLRSVGRALLDVVFPRCCVECCEAVEAGPLQNLCATCRDKIEFAREPHCTTCGWPFSGAVSGARTCANCIDLEPEFGQGRTGMLLRGPARTFVHELKYHRGWHLRGDLRVLVQQAQPLKNFAEGAVLVPVPLHPRRRRWRGFNQARWVAEALAAQVEVAGIDELLLRIRDTPTQTRLSRRGREENMKNAFALRPGVVLSSGRRYVLVDDVFTTGATLNECAKVLRQAGAEHIDVASLGHG